MIKFQNKEKFLLSLAKEAIKFLQPDLLIRKAFSSQIKNIDFKRYKHIYVVGAGKATYKMAQKLNKILGKKITKGFINVPVAETKKIGKIIVNKASHPYPDKQGQKGAEEILKIAKGAKKDDLLICLISGGGSALMPLPSYPLTLQDKINLTKKLLKSKADIHEINVVRKHISQIKGGRLAKVAEKSNILGLYISDVIGDKLESIASGPTVADKSTIADALKILKKYKIADKKIIAAIKNNESPKELNTKKIHNFIIGSNREVLEHLKKTTKKKIEILPNFLQGEATKMAKKLLSKAKKNHVTIAGGETVVEIKGNGQGGRNQELALAAIKHIEEGEYLMTLATDGVDGITKTPVAGAIIHYGLKSKITNKQINEYLKNNDSYKALKKLNCLIETGPSGTNVGDIAIVWK